jgi:hypothetical protein
MKKQHQSADIRTMCDRCRAAYDAAGFKLRQAPTKYKEPCDICGRPGRNYFVSKLFELQQL